MLSAIDGCCQRENELSLGVSTTLLDNAYSLEDLGDTKWTQFCFVLLFVCLFFMDFRFHFVVFAYFALLVFDCLMESCFFFFFFFFFLDRKTQRDDIKFCKQEVGKMILEEFKEGKFMIKIYFMKNFYIKIN